MLRICGAGIGFLGFGLSLIIGLAVGNCFTTVVLRAVVVLFMGYMLGCVLFWIGQQVILENFEAQVVQVQTDKTDDVDGSSIPDEQQSQEHAVDINNQQTKQQDVK